MEEFANLPQIPHDPGDKPHDALRNDDNRHGRVPDFTDNMIAAINPTWITPDSILENGLLVRTWYIHHETQLRNEQFRMVQLLADRTQWIQQLLGCSPVRCFPQVHNRFKLTKFFKKCCYLLPDCLSFLFLDRPQQGDTLLSCGNKPIHGSS